MLFWLSREKTRTRQARNNKRNCHLWCESLSPSHITNILIHRVECFGMFIFNSDPRTPEYVYILLYVHATGTDRLTFYLIQSQCLLLAFVADIYVHATSLLVKVLLAHLTHFTSLRCTKQIQSTLFAFVFLTSRIRSISTAISTQSLILRFH